MSWLAPYYPLIKAFHIIAVVAWMAGLLYLPRLFVYHAEAPAGSPMAETFKLMERRLLRGIMNPAMIGAFVFGLMLLSIPGIVDWHAGWIYAKLVLVAALAVFHHLLGTWRKDFAADRNRRPARFYRMVNELPMLALIAIVILVVMKPF
jgi:putative membrane protein